jgi:hypothetical protein
LIQVLKDRTNQCETPPKSATDGPTVKVSKPAVINEVKKFEAFRSQEIDYGFYFKVCLLWAKRSHERNTAEAA